MKGGITAFHGLTTSQNKYVKLKNRHNEQSSNCGCVIFRLSDNGRLTHKGRLGPGNSGGFRRSKRGGG